MIRNNNPFIYLAGNLTYFKQLGDAIYEDRVLKWRNKMVEWLEDNNISYFNPADTFKKIQAHLYDDKSIVEQNRYYLNKTDILIADINELDKSFGTIFEIIYASEVLKIPVIGVLDSDESSGFEYSPHLKNCITECLNDVEDVIDYITVMYM